MACSMKSGLQISGLNEGLVLKSKTKGALAFSPSFGFQQKRDPKSEKFPLISVDFMGINPIVIPDQMGLKDWNPKSSRNFSVHAQASLCVSRALRWWEKTLKPNMVEIHSAQEFVDSLKNAGDRLVIVDFYSPGCGGCKTLHPKICQLAESNPNAIFVKVNYEELKNMCYSLHIHVLPFFRFYRGADGRLCSFSCTNATIKKFKDALAKHGPDRCSLGPAKGLNESELMNLASVGELTSLSLPLPSIDEDKVVLNNGIDLSGQLIKSSNMMEIKKDIAMLMV